MLIEFYLMLDFIGVDYDPIRHIHMVILFYQKAVCSKLQYVATMGHFCPAALDLYRDQPAFSIPDDIVRLAGEGHRWGVKNTGRPIQIRVDHLALGDAIFLTHGSGRGRGHPGEIEKGEGKGQEHQGGQN